MLTILKCEIFNTFQIWGAPVELQDLTVTYNYSSDVQIGVFIFSSLCLRCFPVLTIVSYHSKTFLNFLKSK